MTEQQNDRQHIAGLREKALLRSSGPLTIISSWPEFEMTCACHTLLVRKFGNDCAEHYIGVYAIEVSENIPF
jgi:hypothetical protein